MYNTNVIEKIAEKLVRINQLLLLQPIQTDYGSLK
jgi:hypothetical protein